MAISKKFGTSFAYIEYMTLEYIYLDVLFVEEEYRNRGIARDLMEKFIQFCKDENYNSILLYACGELGADVYRLVEFYKSLGFVSNCSPIHGYPNINMRLEIKE